jgi:hypothetical protein
MGIGEPYDPERLSEVTDIRNADWCYSFIDGVGDLGTSYLGHYLRSQPYGTRGWILLIFEYGEMVSKPRNDDYGEGPRVENLRVVECMNNINLEPRPNVEPGTPGAEEMMRRSEAMEHYGGRQRRYKTRARRARKNKKKTRSRKRR